MSNIEAAVHELTRDLSLLELLGDFNTGQLNNLAKRRAGYEPLESMVMFRVEPYPTEHNELGALAEGDNPLHDMAINNLLNSVAATHYKKTLYEDGQDDIYSGVYGNQEAHILITEWHSPPPIGQSTTYPLRKMVFGVLPGPALQGLDDTSRNHAVKLGISPSAAAGMSVAQLWVYKNFSLDSRDPVFFENLPD